MAIEIISKLITHENIHATFVTIGCAGPDRQIFAISMQLECVDVDVYVYVYVYVCAVNRWLLSVCVCVCVFCYPCGFVFICEVI